MYSMLVVIDMFGIAVTNFNFILVCSFYLFFAVVTVVFDEIVYTASEGESPLEVCAEIESLIGNLDCDLVVTFAALPGTAGMTINKMLLLHDGSGRAEISEVYNMI